MSLGGLQTMATDEVWRMGVASFLHLGKLVRIMAILGMVSVSFLTLIKIAELPYTILVNLPGQFSATRQAKRNWARWITLAKPLIKMGLMKPSQIDSRLWIKYFLALLPRLLSPDGDTSFVFQHRLPVDGLKVQPMLPRPKQEFEEKQQLVLTTMSSQLMPPIASIIDKLSEAPAKLDLCVDDLEYYFLQSGLIELKFSQQNSSYQSLHIFYRGDPLLITCLTEFVRGSCRGTLGHNRRTCFCNPNFEIVYQLARAAKVCAQLQKNITFIQALSPWMLANLISPEPTPRRQDYLTVAIESILPWTEQLQRESKSVTIEFSSVCFMVNDPTDDKVRRYPNLKFVGVEH